MELLLGMDIGTTNTKIRLYDEEGRIRGEKNFPTPLVSQGGVEFYVPEDIATSIVQAISDFDRALLSCVVALSVSSFAEVMVGLYKDGTVLPRSIPWYSDCTKSQFSSIELDEEEVYWTTGLSPQHKYSFYKLLWHREMEPELFAKVRFWTSMSGFILFFFSGELSFDYSLASRTMLFDQKKRNWWEAMCERAGVPIDRMAPLYPSGKPLGKIRPEVAKVTGLHPETTIVVGGHDHLCAALASGVYQPGWVLISSGTTESVTMALHETPFRKKASWEKPFSWGHHVAYPAYYVMNGIYSGGYAVDWTMRLLKENHAVFQNLSLSLSPAIPLFFPYLLGSYYEAARGAFFNLSAETKEREILFGVLLGLCLEYRHIFDMVCDEVKIPIDEAVNVGGGTKNRTWMNLKASVLGREILVPEDREGSCKGAALLAGLGSGVYRDYHHAFSQTFRVEETFLPQEEYQWDLERWFQVYRELREDLKSLNEKLRRIFS